MTTVILLKIAIVIVLLAIVASLGFGALFLIRDQSRSHRVVHALTVRIGLSVVLFLLVVALVLFGVLEPNPSPLQ